ncbi:hypothetical protein ACQP3L_36460, partial [Escherichia coli]
MKTKSYQKDNCFFSCLRIAIELNVALKWKLVSIIYPIYGPSADQDQFPRRNSASLPASRR